MTYRQFFTVRVVAGILLAVVVLWGFWAVLSIFEKDEPAHVVMFEEDKHLLGLDEAEEPLHPVELPPIGDEHLETPDEAIIHGEPAHELPHEGSSELSDEPGHAVPEMETPHELKANGVAFVEAMTSALDHELNKRAWGWRCNDMLQFTDNVENIQLGVLEVVRRATVVLTERISRHGATDIIDKNLENAMNWFMIKPDQYWLPAPESRYNDALKELQAYAEKLERGEARFYTRADSLIPLLTSFSELLGGCDESLVKSKEEDGSPVKWSKVDDYFFYAKGVAKAMGPILHAVQTEFADTVESRHGMDLLEHAIHSCHIAAEMDPWLVTNASLDGILANHRANMAAPISHARYYLTILAKTLST
ncbi:MAG: DUF2333 family protein [Deltaproteobacteria bacterium]|nr:DUF2333 family protein [Deltaproteobacteria bacterium]